MRRLPPCLVDPEAWDVDPGPGRGPHPPIDQLIQACLTQCPAIVKCRALDRGDCYGVVAGQYRPWPAPAILATAFRQGAMSRVAAAVRVTVEHSKPGQVLPQAAELARLYGVSGTTVRSALLALADEHVLIRPANRRQWYRVPERTENAA